MDFPSYVCLYNYVYSKTYPINATDNVKAGIRAKSKKYLASNGKLFERVKQSDGVENYCRHSLHEGTIEAAVLKVHNEGHLGVNYTWNRDTYNS